MELHQATFWLATMRVCKSLIPRFDFELRGDSMAVMNRLKQAMGRNVPPEIAALLSGSAAPPDSDADVNRLKAAMDAQSQPAGPSPGDELAQRALTLDMQRDRHSMADANGEPPFGTTGKPNPRSSAPADIDQLVPAASGNKLRAAMNAGKMPDAFNPSALAPSAPTDDLRPSTAGMMGGQRSLPEPGMMAPKPLEPTRLQDLQSQYDQASKPKPLWQRVLMGVGGLVPIAQNVVAGIEHGRAANRGTLLQQIEQERGFEARGQEQDKSLAERQSEFNTTQEANRPWRESQINLNREKVESDKANRNQAQPTVTTDNGVMQWDPATHSYSIRVGGAKAKGSAQPVFEGEQFIGMKDPESGSVAVPGTAEWAKHPEYQQFANAAANAHRQGVRESINTAGAKAGAEETARGRIRGITDPVYAYDPTSQKTVLTTKGDAQDRGMLGVRTVKQGDIAKDQHDTNVLNDIASKANNVRSDASALDGASWGQVAKISKLLADNPQSTLDQVVRSGAMAGLSPQAQRYVININSMRESAMGLQKVLTGSARSNETQLNALLNTLPGLEPSSDIVHQKLGAFTQNIDMLRKGIPEFPGMPVIPTGSGGGNSAGAAIPGRPQLSGKAAKYGVAPLENR
jgi:hypothetical protein